VASDWDAASFDRVSDPQARWALDVIDRVAGDPSVILDAGCGSGRVTELLLDRFPDADVIGLDASGSMIEQARQRLEKFGKRVTLAHMSLLQPIPFTVDTVFSNAVFHWVDDHDRLFANLAQVLRPDGQLVAQWGGKGNVARLIEAADATHVRGPHPRRSMGAEETTERLRRAGFEEIRVWLHDAPADFATREEFVEYMRTVCLRCHLDLVPESERDAFLNGVADRLPDMRIDYVRINAVAHRAAT